MRRLLIMASAAAVAVAFLAANAGAGSHTGSKRSSKPQTVQVREIAVKSSPNYLSQTVGRLGFGDRVDIASTEGNWYRIENPSGYIPTNAVGKSSASVEASQRYAATGVTHDETALAGKGFNPQVEGQYKKSSASLAAAYGQVDRVERMTVSDSALTSFISQGQLNR